MAWATSSRSCGLIVRAEEKEGAVPMNSDKTNGDLLDLSWHTMNSIEVVFMPSRREVMRARSATERRPKYSSLSIAWWLLVSCKVDWTSSVVETDAANQYVLVVNRGKVQGPIRAVDMADQFRTHSLQFGTLTKRGRGDLHQNHLAPPFRVGFQKLFKRLQLVVDAFSNVQLFATDDDLFVMVHLTQGLHFRLNTRLVPFDRDALDVDTDRAVPDGRDAAVCIDTARGGFKAAHADTGGDKVPRVGVGLEDDDIGSEHAFEDLATGLRVSQVILA